MDILKWLVLAAVGVYAVIVAAMYVGQRGLVFPRRPERTAPAPAGFPEAQEHILTTKDGERLVTWLRPPVGDTKPLFLMFLGNGDNLGIIAPRLREMTEDGSGILAVGYRGYSGSTGSPSEAGAHRGCRSRLSLRHKRRRGESHRAFRLFARIGGRDPACSPP